MTIGVIPARGRSKGVVRKNVRVVGGKPLIVHSIDHSLSCPLIEATYVVTDDPEIAQISLDAGAKVIDEPKALAEDWSTDYQMLLYTLTVLDTYQDLRPELIVHLRPTHPVREMDETIQAITLLAHHPEADAVRSVSLARETPYKMWTMDSTSRLVPVMTTSDYAEPWNIQRQRLPVVYWQNGCVDVTRWNTVMKLQSMTGRMILGLLIESDPHVEIDTEESLRRVDEILRRPEEHDVSGKRWSS